MEGGSASDLGGVCLKSIQDCSIRHIIEASFGSPILVLVVPLAQSLWAEVPGIAKGLMGTGHGILLGHKDLAASVSFAINIRSIGRTRSNAVEHARGCVATKMGFWDILDATVFHCWQAMFQVLLQDAAGRKILYEICLVLIMCQARTRKRVWGNFLRKTALSKADHICLPCSSLESRHSKTP